MVILTSFFEFIFDFKHYLGLSSLCMLRAELALRRFKAKKSLSRAVGTVAFFKSAKQKKCLEEFLLSPPSTIWEPYHFC